MNKYEIAAVAAAAVFGNEVLSLLVACYFGIRFTSWLWLQAMAKGV